MRNCKILGKKYSFGNWNISKKKLVSLEGSPNHITGRFNCSYNDITSLIGGPQKVNGDYNCEYNQLTDLVGCASHIGSELNFIDNNITSLVGIHKIIKSCQGIYFDQVIITQGGIGLLLIENLDEFSHTSMPFSIIKSYLGTGTKGMMECRAKLIEEGYANYAKL